jgi:acetyl esterase/lipase
MRSQRIGRNNKTPPHVSRALLNPARGAVRESWRWIDSSGAVRTFVLLAIAALLTACSPIALVNVAVPEKGYTRTADLPYAEHSRQTLDVYTPTSSSAQPRPVVVFFYGGGWESGRRGDYRFVAEALTSRGFVTVIPDYRVYPEVVFPDFLLDAAKATRWVRRYITGFGGDPDRIFIMGHSAGAYLAAMLALDPQYIEEVGLSRAQIRGMIGLAGPYDFTPIRGETLRKIFGPESEEPHTQPINYVDGHNPPMLLITGGKDITVRPGNTYRLASKIKMYGGPVKMIELPDADHTDVIVQLAAPFRGDGEVLQAVTDFVRGH